MWSMCAMGLSNGEQLRFLGDAAPVCVSSRIWASRGSDRPGRAHPLPPPPEKKFVSGPILHVPGSGAEPDLKPELLAFSQVPHDLAHNGSVCTTERGPGRCALHGLLPQIQQASRLGKQVRPIPAPNLRPCIPDPCPHPYWHRVSPCSLPFGLTGVAQGWSHGDCLAARTRRSGLLCVWGGGRGGVAWAGARPGLPVHRATQQLPSMLCDGGSGTLDGVEGVKAGKLAGTAGQGGRQCQPIWEFRQHDGEAERRSKSGSQRDGKASGGACRVRLGAVVIEGRGGEPDRPTQGPHSMQEGQRAADPVHPMQNGV